MKHWCIAILLSLYGCAQKIETPQEKTSLIKLDDGTRCAVYEGFKQGGISCDWK